MATADNREGEFSLTEPVSAPQGEATRARTKKDTETLGESSGSFLGATTGASIGAIGGPVGLIIGAIAGAVGGWWAGHGIAEAVTHDDEEHFRHEYESSPHRFGDRGYDEVRPAYVTGYLAGRNPDYRGRSFDEVESDLSDAWGPDVVNQFGSWPSVRGFARSAFDRARQRGD